MALGTGRFFGIRKLANGQKPTIRADVSGIVDDIGDAVFGSGAALPTAAAAKWPGRSWFHTTERTWYVCDGTEWLPVGGTRSIVLSTFGAPASGYAYDNAEGASYVYRSGKQVFVRLRLRKTSGALSHGVNGGTIYAVNAAYRPAGVGSWPLAANQSGGASSASVVAAILDASGAIAVLSPNGTSHTVELNGSYFIP